MAQLTRARDIAGLLAFLALSLSVSGVGGAVTASSVGGWYRSIAKPPFNPPDWICAPVWTALFVMMSVAAWRVWRRHGLRGAPAAMALYALQLALNLGWSVLFFGLQMIGAALAEVAALLAAIVATTVLFWRLDRAAGMLFIPYAGWVGFATVLNAALWRLN